MTGQRWLLANVAAIVLASSGCMTCCHDGYHLAREVGPECELPTCQRNDVYVFAISSLNPISIVALDGLREQLNRQGFAKVATGQTIHTGWMAREMRRIRDTEPDAIFVIVGFESGRPAAVALADKVAAQGIPVSGVIVIGTEGTAPPSRQGLRVLALGKVEEMATANAEPVPVGNVASYGLATDARTVEAVGNLLKEIASTAPISVVAEVAEWSYPHAPPMREVGDPARDPEWSFLFDQYAAATQPPATPPPPAPPTLTTPITRSGGVLNSAIR
jgi:hypothetical protein